MRRALELFGILDDRDVEWLLANGAVRWLKPDAVLISEGEPIEAMSIVLDGSLSVRTAASGGREIAELLSGDIVGEISFVDSRAPSASVFVVHACQLLTIPSARIRAKLQADSPFAARFYRAIAVLLAGRLRKTTARLGYGRWDESEGDGLDDDNMNDISVAARRFDELLQRVQPR